MEARGGKIATVGMFDGVHLGHRWLINRLVSEGGKRGLSPLVITFGQHPLTVIAPQKAPKCLMPVTDRVERLMECGVDDVVVMDFDESLQKLTALQFIEMLRDNYDVRAILMGFNHHFGSDRLGSFEAYKEAGEACGVEIIRGDELSAKIGVSSSLIRRHLSAGDVESAAEMLGRSYEITGEVVHGKQLGRKLGFPTANIRPVDADQLIPAAGVYAVDVDLGYDVVRRAMLNIGVRPTVDKVPDAPMTMEAHIIDWEGDLYGHRVAMKFVKRLRDEKCFDSLDSLKTQLHSDLTAARQA